MKLHLVEIDPTLTTSARYRWRCVVLAGEPTPLETKEILQAQGENPQEAVINAINAMQIAINKLVERAQRDGLLAADFKQGPYR